MLFLFTLKFDGLLNYNGFQFHAGLYEDFTQCLKYYEMAA